MDYYSYRYYWGGMGPWGRGAYPGMLLPGYGGLAMVHRTCRQQT